MTLIISMALLGGPPPEMRVGPDVPALQLYQRGSS